MQLDKAMIDLVQEVRRRTSSDDKPDIRLANPGLFHHLLRIYDGSTDAVSRALIKDLFSRAGDPWVEALDEPQDAVPRYTTRVYRGQVVR